LLDSPPHRPNCKIVAAASTRSSPEKDAAPDDATATVGFLIDDKVPAHIAIDRRSSDDLADPLPPPPVSSLSPSTTTNPGRAIYF
jgi:hypothetical protein